MVFDAYLQFSYFCIRLDVYSVYHGVVWSSLGLKICMTGPPRDKDKELLNHRIRFEYFVKQFKMLK